jgi:hypothetical protein
MKLSGFSYIRNGLELGYPFLESISSVLSVCDEFVIAVGDSSDGTREAIQGLNSPKIKIIDTVWDLALRKEGKIFAQQTNFALDNISGDWALHIQADEVLHEKDITKIREAIELVDADERVEGFIQPFLHFWGNYNYIRNSRRVHRYEIRIFRNRGLIRSFRDSQGFRKYSSPQGYLNGEKGEKLKVKILDVPVYHYNAVRSVSQMKKKVIAFDSAYSNEINESDERYSGFDYQKIDRLARFNGQHPKVMNKRIEELKDDFIFDPKKAVWITKDRILQPIEDFLGFKIGEYKNYKLLKD